MAFEKKTKQKQKTQHTQQRIYMRSNIFITK